MADRTPYNSKFCKEVKCIHRHGNMCAAIECIYNHKWIMYWEKFDILLMNIGEGE